MATLSAASRELRVTAVHTTTQHNQQTLHMLIRAFLNSVMSAALSAASRELRVTAVQYKGYMCSSTGDYMLFVFPNCFTALSYCLQVQECT